MSREPRPNLRNLLIKPASEQLSEKKEEGFAGFEIPTEYYETRHEAERFDLFEILDVGPEVPAGYDIGDIILVETAMLDVIETPYGTVTFVPYNYVPITFD